MTDPTLYLQKWSDRYKNDLLGNIMPFWLKNGWDRIHGGVYTCLNRDGSLMDRTKSVWFQGRFAFTCSFAYNNVEKNLQWLEAAKSTLDFIEHYCFDKDGRMYFTVTEDGKPIRKRRYVFSETFAAIAMAEYALATGDKEYAQKAFSLFNDIRRFLNTPNLLEPKFESAVQLRSHSITMILINVASRIKKVYPDIMLDEQVNESIYQIQHYFIHPEYKALLETVGPNGEFIDTNLTRTINPGHCIETSWFMMEEAFVRRDDKLLETALTILDWSWEWGWDEQYGGIINFKDCKNLPPQDYSQDMKFWWPQCEAIIANLYAYYLTDDIKYLERHQLISDWTYSHFPDNEYDEWFGYLHRDGSVAQPAKGNLFKGPFHIPRMMIMSYCLCQRILLKSK